MIRRGLRRVITNRKRGNWPAEETAMETTRSMRRLIDDAKARGLTVREREQFCDINRGKTLRSLGIRIWPDGTATRNDIELSLCLAIRTQKQMREILGLTKIK
jgi:hypothetical protein